MSIGFLGAGKMAQAMTRGLLAAEFPLGVVLNTEEAGHLSDALLEEEGKDKHLLILMGIAPKASGLGVSVTWDNQEAASGKQVVVLAVKPNVIKRVLNEVAPVISRDSLVVSLAAGVKTRTIEQSLPGKSRVVRVMPNIPTLIRQGASVFSLGLNADSEDAEVVRRLMSAVGYVEEVEEKQVAAVTSLSGSGPAYCFMAIEALADGGVKAGLPRDLSVKLAAHTLMGAARLVLETGKHPGELKDHVCSPEGTTSYAVHSLERAGFRATLMDAVETGLKRTLELGAKI